MSRDLIAQLEPIFKPKSIAFIGASNDRRKWGEWMVWRPLHTGFRGALYPVNPREQQILGLPAFRSILDIPDEVDLAVITVPEPLVPQVMRECGQKGVRGAIVITAGFGEKGPEGRAAQDEVVRIAGEAGIRFVGPNCMGIVSTAGRLNLCFAQAPRAGTISFLSQSGTFGVYLYQMAAAKGYGLSKLVSMGNQADLNAADFLEYLAQDEDTRVIVLYIEGVQQGRRFFETAREVVKRKPIVIYKAGKTAAGSRATMSHTGSLAGTDAIFDAMCRQVGLIRAHEATHLFDMAEALACQQVPRGRRVAIVGGGGGQCVVTADYCASLGLEVPEFDAETQRRLQEELAPHAPFPRNPVDLGGGLRSPMSLANIVDIVASLDYIDGIITNPPAGAFGRSGDLARIAIDAAEVVAAVPKKYGKPVIASGRRQETAGIVQDILKGANIPSYDTPEECTRAMYALAQYGQTLRELGVPPG